MRRYWAVASAVFLLFLVSFAAVENLAPELFAEPRALMDAGGLAGLVGVALLVADVVLPVPSSVVMLAHGALFGLVVGALLSVVGNLGAALVGFAIGRRGGPAMSRFVSPQERARADRMLAEWGAMAIIVTRPLPMVAETTTILAGASPMSWRRLIGAVLAGSVPLALLYGWAGAAATTFDSVVPVFGLAIAMAGVFWTAGRLGRASPRPSATDASRPPNVDPNDAIEVGNGYNHTVVS
jgi:3-dehydroquinate synthase